MKILFYDFETNGLDTSQCGILQTSILNEQGDVIFNQYTYPYDNKIEGTEIHGIDENTLIQHHAIPSNVFFVQMFETIHRLYEDETEEIVWCAYNNFGYDQLVFEYHCERFNLPIPDTWSFMDIYPCIKELYPSIQPNYKLKTVYEYFFSNDSTIQFHNSLDDTRCLMQLYQKICESRRDKNILFHKYHRKSFSNHSILYSPISSLQGYHPNIPFHKHHLLQMNDLYEVFKTVDNKNEFVHLMKHNYNIYSAFITKQLYSQLEHIHHFSYLYKKRKINNL